MGVPTPPLGVIPCEYLATLSLQILEEMSYQMLETARSYLHLFGHNNGVWWTDGRTELYRNTAKAVYWSHKTTKLVFRPCVVRRLNSHSLLSLSHCNCIQRVSARSFLFSYLPHCQRSVISGRSQAWSGTLQYSSFNQLYFTNWMARK